MICPNDKCKSLDISVVHTHRYKTSYIRNRICNKCKYQWVTEEVEIDFKNEFGNKNFVENLIPGSDDPSLFDE